MAKRHSRFSEIRGEVTPDRRARIDAIKAQMAAGQRLAELRAIAGVTQVDVAAAMGLAQPSVSNIEKRDDILVSTLRSYVEALGGELEVTAVLADGQRTRIRLGGAA